MNRQSRFPRSALTMSERRCDCVTARYSARGAIIPVPSHAENQNRLGRLAQDARAFIALWLLVVALAAGMHASAPPALQCHPGQAETACPARTTANPGLGALGLVIPPRLPLAVEWAVLLAGLVLGVVFPWFAVGILCLMLGISFQLG